MKDTYLSAKYYSLVGRRGKKRALIAVGHKILIMAYYILKTGTPYKELGNDYLNRRKKDKIVKNHVKRLQDLGYAVELKKAAAWSSVKEKNDSTGQRSNLTGGYNPVGETDLARCKNKGMLPRARRGNFYDLPGLLLNIQLFNKIILKGTFSGEMLSELGE